MTKKHTESEMRSTIYHRWDAYNDQYRVWRPFWAGDQFEMVGRDNFNAMRKLMERLSFSFVEVDDSEEN